MDRTLRRKIQQSGKFKQLTSERSRFGRGLSLVMVAVYYSFIFAVALFPQAVGAPLWDGAAVTVGFPLGVGVILIAFALTGIYVQRANGHYDRLTRDIIEEAKP